jgi:hypothetical protein
MQLVSILILLLSQTAVADVTAKKPIRESCQETACSSRQDRGAKEGNPRDARVSPDLEKESPQPSSGAGGEPAGSLYKNQVPKRDTVSSGSRASAGGESPGASYKNRPPAATGSVPK